MLPDRVSNPGPLTYESGALLIALRGPAAGEVNDNTQCMYPLTVKANAIAWLCGQGIATLSLSKIFLKHVVIYQENLYGER